MSPMPPLTTAWIFSLYFTNTGSVTVLSTLLDLPCPRLLHQRTRRLLENIPLTCFLKGTFELRPSLPRYSTTWDVSIVLTYLRSFPALNDLTLKQLTLNLTMLLALVTTQQTQTLSKLDTSCMQETTTRITFTIRDTLKTTQPGKHLVPIQIRPFTPDSCLCPVTYIKHYITKTHSLISYTVDKWIRSTL